MWGQEQAALALALALALPRRSRQRSQDSLGATAGELGECARGCYLGVMCLGRGRLRGGAPRGETAMLQERCQHPRRRLFLRNDSCAEAQGSRTMGRGTAERA